VSSGVPPLIYAEDLSTNGTYLCNSLDDQPTGPEKRIGRGGARVLLKKGDWLRISLTITLRFQYSSRIPTWKASGLSSLQKRESQVRWLFSIYSFYLLTILKLFKDRFVITDQKLGSGGHGSVFVAVHKWSNRQLACKVIDLQPYEEDDTYLEPLSPEKRQQQLLIDQKRRTRLDPQFREFDVLKDLDHPNIIRLEKVFWSADTLYIFQELVTGGDLFSFIEYKGGRLSDIEAAVVLRQVLKAIEYLHDLNIVHRDLKPDNVLMTSWADGARVILTDFGNARLLTEPMSEKDNLPASRRRMLTVVGTLEYTAP
jgi:pheromone a factor receptor